jgi:cellobiose phosphorylase
MLGHGERAFELFQMINPLAHTATPEGVARYKVEPRFGRSTCHIVVRSPGLVRPGLAVVTLDGQPLDGEAIPLRDDGREHEVVVAPR